MKYISTVSAEKALALWQQANLLDQAKAEELAHYLEEHRGGANRTVKIFAALGAVLAGLGMILFVASHWAGMSPFFVS